MFCPPTGERMSRAQLCPTPIQGLPSGLQTCESGASDDTCTSTGLSALGPVFPDLRMKTLNAELSLHDPEKLSGPHPNLA